VIARSVGNALVLLVASLLVGCATVPPAPRQPIAPEARAAIDALEERWRRFSGLRTLAHIRAQRGGQRQEVQGVLLARPPGSVRFEALSPMGQPLLIAVVHEGQLIAYDLTTDEVTTGVATPEVTARVLGLPFEPHDLVAVLAGHAVPPNDVRSAEMLPADGAGVSLELFGRDNRRRIWLDPATGVVRQMELTGGRAEARIVYARGTNGEPAGFDLTAMMSYIRASVRYQNPDFEAQIDPELFALTVPNTAKIRQIR
jgi:outer membrane lipoprotein-sorting protein